MQTVRDALAAARAQRVDRLDAQLLLAHHLGRPRAWLLAHDDAPLGEAAAPFAAQLSRRAAGEPLAYLLGQWTFRGLALAVSPAVLVPRPETEVLVEWALEVASGRAIDIVDLGTGSGAIAVALALALPQARLVATDASADALAVGRANAQRHGARIEFVHGDWWQPLAGRRFDLVVSNPPYIAAGDPHLAALMHEPEGALTSGSDGLDALRRIVAGAPGHLQPGGAVLVEHGHDQGAAVTTLLTDRGLHAASTRMDLAGLPRCSGAFARE